MTDRELMQQSLDALEGNDLGLHYRTIDALRAALAQTAPAVPDGLRGAVNALLHQIEIGDFVDSNGHSAKMLKPVHDLMRLISESAAPAVREPLHAWEFVAMWATAAEKHGNTYDAAVEFGCAVEARCAAAPAVREPKPLAAVNRYCAAGMCLPKDQHEAGCTAHGIGTQGGGT